MANETTSSTANDLFFAAWIGDMVVEEQRPYSVIKQFMWFQGGRESDAFTWPIQDDPGAAANVVEATGLSNTALNTSAATATATIEGQMATVTDFLSTISRTDAMSHFAQVLGRSVAERIEDVCADLLDDFSNESGSTGVDASPTTVIEAVGALEARDVVGQLVGVLHPVQVQQVREGLQVTANAHFHANPNMDTGVMANLDAPAGFAGTVFNVPLYQTSTVNTANTAADRLGAIFRANHALGYYELWAPRVELERDASLPGTEIVATTSFGVVEILDREGQGFLSSAT